ncbi:metallophosphoesterase family protein [Photobacterium aquimaris]|uniref:metallophosphoesterase family protein n=1 Tax=Photobacterium aquimaris TaxID=512643 RepID=UPI00142DFDD3|nr:metallophosphoesterase [Photobacterium aquimaris]
MGYFWKKTHFKTFFNKKVISLDELRHQDRTIWFFKHFENGHSEHEILLYNSNAVIPTVFPNNYVKVNDSKIHWVSDLHFSEGANQHGFNNQLLNSSLYSIIEKEFKYTLNALIVSGDMTWSASKDEFDQTVKFYTDLSSNTQLDLSKICFCPGNHDLSYQGTLTGEQKEALEKLHLLQRGEKITKEGGLEGRDNLTKDEISSLQSLETTEVAKDAYEQHFVTVTSAKPNEFLSMGKKFLINNQRAVEICLLNSNRMQQYKYLFQGNGFIGEDQRSDAAHEMGWTTSKGYGALRIVVLHHNLLPVEYSNIPYIGSSPGSYVYDSQATLKWCYKHDVDVILHGHTHQRSAMKLSDFDIKNNITKSVWIVGLGSTGVHHSHIVPTHTNQLAELDFSNKHIEIQFYDIVNNEVVRSGESLKLE